MPTACPFCEIPESRTILHGSTTFAIEDKYPVSEGHTLVVPKRHFATYWEATASEKLELWGLVDQVRERLLQTHRPDGFNVGFNAGHAAGQTVDHMHIHVIPRYAGDMPNPAGGVRGVIPDRMDYR